MEKSPSHYLHWSIALLKPYRLPLMIFLLLELVGIFFSLSFVYWSKKAVDYAIHGTRLQVEQALIWTGGSILLGIMVQLISNRTNEKMRASMLIKLQNGIMHRQLLSTWQVIKKWHTGDIQVRIQSDCNEIVQMVGYTFWNSMLTCIKLLASFTFLWLLDPKLAVLILAISPLVALSKLYFRRYRKLTQELKQADSEFGHVVQENLRFRMSIKALGLHQIRWQKLDAAQNNTYRLKLRLLNFSTLSQGIMKSTVNAGFLFTFVWGVLQLQAHLISFGTLTAFLQLVSRIQGPVLQLLGFVPAFIRFRTSVERLQVLAIEEIEEIDHAEVISAPTSLLLQNISFKYDEIPVLNAFNAMFKKNEPTALIGPSGRGKTTLIRILLALLKTTAGSVHIVTEEKQIPLAARHRINFGYVPQGDKLFSGTIRENLLSSTKQYNEKQYKSALETACANFVYELPLGLDTIIGESGYGLSEGQAQRIAIARAVLCDRSCYLFDEITSALDQATAEKLMENLIQFGKNKILIFVTHDLNLTERCTQRIFIS